MKMYQLTQWLDPDERTATMYGIVNNMEWLRREQERLLDEKREARIVHRQTDDTVAIFTTINFDGYLGRAVEI